MAELTTSNKYYNQQISRIRVTDETRTKAVIRLDFDCGDEERGAVVELTVRECEKLSALLSKIENAKELTKIDTDVITAT